MMIMISQKFISAQFGVNVVADANYATASTAAAFATRAKVSPRSTKSVQCQFKVSKARPSTEKPVHNQRSLYKVNKVNIWSIQGQ